MREWRERVVGGATALAGDTTGVGKRAKRQLRAFGIAFHDGQLIRSQSDVSEIRPVAGARASVLAATDGVSLIVQGPDFEWLAPCLPADREEARRLSTEINTASQEIAEDEAFWAALPR